MSHSVSSTRTDRTAVADESSVGSLVQSAMADVSTLIRSEIELAKAEIGTSAKKAGVSIASFAVAGVMAAFAGIFLFITLAEALTALGLPRWVSYALVTVFLLLLAGVAFVFLNPRTGPQARDFVRQAYGSLTGE